MLGLGRIQVAFDAERIAPPVGRLLGDPDVTLLMVSGIGHPEMRGLARRGFAACAARLAPDERQERRTLYTWLTLAHDHVKRIPSISMVDALTPLSLDTSTNPGAFSLEK